MAAAGEIVVNGDRRPIEAEATVARLVAELGLDPRAVAVEHNGAIVPRDGYPTTRLAPGDRIEIVRFVQGG